MVAEDLFLAALGLSAEALDLGFAAVLFVEVAIKLRYHPASQVKAWASNRYMKIVRWIGAADFGPGRGVPLVRGLWLR